jgi:hypothetical protein
VAERRKVLNQKSPGAGVLADLYTVPDNYSTVCSSLTVCNRDSRRTEFRISIAVDGDADENKQYVFYDTPVDGNRTYIATIGITLAAGDVVRCYSASGQLSFGLFGSEKSV